MDGQANVERWEIKGVFKSRTCPRRLVTAESEMWLSLYPHYRAGHLYRDGGVSQQPALYLEAMRHIDYEVNRG